MKKTLISAVILTALFATGCQDKEAQAKIEQLNQTITQLQTELSAEKAKAEKVIPAIFAEEDVVFEKSEEIKYPPSKEDYLPEEGYIKFSFSTLKTNIDWLDTILWDKLTNYESDVPTREKVVADYLESFNSTRKEMLDNPIIGFESHRWLSFIGQREKLATFASGYSEYSGGAHGIDGNRYFTVDLINRKVLTFDDLFEESQLPKIYDLLWNRYTEMRENSFVEKENFTISDNIYLDAKGVHFIYGVYEIASYAEGEQDLTLYWWQLEDLLKPSFKQQKYIDFNSPETN